MKLEGKTKPIPPLQIGDGKEKPQFEWSGWWKLLVNKFIGFTINF